MQAEDVVNIFCYDSLLPNRIRTNSSVECSCCAQILLEAGSNHTRHLRRGDKSLLQSELALKTTQLSRFAKHASYQNHVLSRRLRPERTIPRRDQRNLDLQQIVLLCLQ